MESQIGMAIDTTRCMGCQTCVVSCKVAHHTPSGLYWNRVESLDGDTIYQATGTFPNVRLAFRAELCNHCASPACVANCPTGAMTKRDEDGIVVSNPDVCIGCGTCVQACPYSIPRIDEEQSVSSKCNLCYDKLAVGEDPWCVQACPAKARVAGDLNDPESAISKLVAEKGAVLLHEEFGTEPSTRYIVSQ